jgi:hypothetical protein
VSELNADIIAAIIASLSLGGLLSIFVQSIMQKRGKVFEQEFAYREKRYLAIIMLMWARLDEKSGLKLLRQHRPDLPDTAALMNELKTELYNAMLYAKDDVVQCLKVFIELPDHQSFFNVALAMRRDLYGKRTKLVFGDIKVDL